MNRAGGAFGSVGVDGGTASCAASCTASEPYRWLPCCTASADLSRALSNRNQDWLFSERSKIHQHTSQQSGGSPVQPASCSWPAAASRFLQPRSLSPVPQSR